MTSQVTPAPTQIPGSPQAVPNQPIPEADLIKKYDAQLKQLVDVNCKGAVDREKVFQYATIRRNEFYYRGNQRLVPTFAGTSGEIVDFKPVNSQLLLASGRDQSKSRVYDYVINNFRGDIRKFVGVLGSKSPNVKGMPAWSADEIGVKRSEMADQCAGYLRTQWNIESANRYLVLSLAKNGTTFFYTPYVVDKDKYGTRTEPVWGTKPEKTGPDTLHCPNCGNVEDASNPVPSCPYCGAPYPPDALIPGPTQDVPAIVDQKEYPQGSVELLIYSPYNVTTPFYIKDMETCPWLWLEEESDAGDLISMYPDRGLEEMLLKGNDIASSTGTSEPIGRLARNQASSPTGYAVSDRINRWVRSRYWLRPSMYWYLLKGGGGNTTLMQALKDQYPRGMKLTFVQEKLVAIEHERLDEVWAATKPETSEYLYADPIFNDYIQGADICNDAWNINVQLLETSIPAIIYSQNALDARKIRNGFQINEFVPANTTALQPMDKNFYKIPTADFKPELFGFQEKVMMNLREIIGLLPAIWGGDENTQTAEQSRRRLNQALMILATTWNEMRGGWAKAYLNGTIQLSRYSLGRLTTSMGDAESVTVKDIDGLGDLVKGGWVFECDQAIPMSWTQLRDFVMEIMTQSNPQTVHAVGMDDPANFDKVAEGIGIPNWKLPGRDERDKIRELIGNLLQGEPIPGMDGVNQPSVPLNFAVQWNPQLLIQVVHEWLMSPDSKGQEGTAGFANVISAGMAALQFMNPPLPPPNEGGPQKSLPPGQSQPESNAGAVPPTSPGQPQPAPEADISKLPESGGIQ